jgi:hypothetical protein
MDFLFIPVSDGYKKQYDVGKELEEREKNLDMLVEQQADGPNKLSKEEYIIKYPRENPHGDSGKEVRTTGFHWSVLIIDLRDADQLHATYFDSWLDDGSPRNISAKDTIVNGVNTILYLSSNQGRAPPSITVATNVPNQFCDIGCKGDETGACAPFVWAMAKEFAQYIIDASNDAREHQKEVSIMIELPEGFKEEWNWNSTKTRKTIRKLVDREKRRRSYLNKGSDDWF